jgi:uncharacterized BrkB/YihY/UPF0761 family membrane protein
MNLVQLGVILDFFDTVGKIISAAINLAFSVGVGYVVVNGIILAIQVSKIDNKKQRDAIMLNIGRLAIAFVIIVGVWLAYSFLLDGNIKAIGGQGIL